MVALILLALALNLALPPVGLRAQGRQEPIPTLAYYYIWFDTNSWRRAKTDYPVLGRYSSDDRAVMRQHVQWAKAAGIDGFIVSWKSTPPLDRRLAQLVQVAQEESFKLLLIYQGLDFAREPIPIDKIAADLDRFTAHYADNPVFDLFGRPTVIWSGTWRFAPQEIAQVTNSRRTDLSILASERNLAGYERVADLVDGNAYYWSSGDPLTTPGYQTKLAAFGEAVHAQQGLWIAPAAAGFDARLLSGSRVIDRRDGVTLRRAFDAAVQSSPDAVGIISWNEFSENSHIEPSTGYGDQSLRVLTDIDTAQAPVILDFDSSEPAATLLGGGQLPVNPERQTLLLYLGESRFAFPLPAGLSTFGASIGIQGDLQIDAGRLGSLLFLGLLMGGSFLFVIRRRLRMPVEP